MFKQLFVNSMVVFIMKYSFIDLLNLHAKRSKTLSCKEILRLNPTGCEEYSCAAFVS